MFDSKYGKVLTVILIILIIVIIGLLCFFGYEKLKKSKNDEEAIAAIEEFNRDHNINTDETDTTSIEETPTADSDEEIAEIISNSSTDSSSSSSTSTSSGTKTMYNGFVMVGYIEIPATNVQLPILEKVTKKSLETSVAIVYPSDAELNQPGNVVIAGHNYRNQMFFSNNKKLKSGDKIYITDESGTKLTYIVYDNFEAAPEDTSFYVRDTGGVPEITLTTCTEDSSKRTIILAKAE